MGGLDGTQTDVIFYYNTIFINELKIFKFLIIPIVGMNLVPFVGRYQLYRTYGTSNTIKTSRINLYKSFLSMKN